MKDNGQLCFCVVLGNYFIGLGSIVCLYCMVCIMMMVGKQWMLESCSYFYQDLMLLVLLDSLCGGWQVNELVCLLVKFKVMDNNGLLCWMLMVWFCYNVQLLVIFKVLFIYCNMLEYWLNCILELIGLDLGNFDDWLLLYVVL